MTRADEIHFGPGVVFTISSGQSYAQDVLDAIGRQVEFGLEWDWPPRLNLRLQQGIVYLNKLEHTRFVRLPFSLDMTPRAIRQRLYREYAA